LQRIKEENAKLRQDLSNQEEQESAKQRAAELAHENEELKQTVAVQKEQIATLKKKNKDQQAEMDKLRKGAMKKILKQQASTPSLPQTKNIRASRRITIRQSVRKPEVPQLMRQSSALSVGVGRGKISPSHKRKPLPPRPVVAPKAKSKPEKPNFVVSTDYF